jgi:hypothetical protein
MKRCSAIKICNTQLGAFGVVGIAIFTVIDVIDNHIPRQILDGTTLY